MRRERLLRVYPPVWRERYGDDFTAYLEDAYPGTMPVRATLSVVAGGLRERGRATLRGDASTPAAHRLRAGTLGVLVAWAAFVLAGASFAKLSEHVDSALAPGPRRLAGDAYSLVQIAAVVSGLAVVVAAALAAPALRRLLSSGGWRLVRRPLAGALLGTAVLALTTVALSGWAQHLTDGQRNGGDTGYSVAFVAWAVLVAVAVALWTGVGVSVGKRISASRSVLLAQGVLAAVVTTGMVVMTVSVAVWWLAAARSGGSAAPSGPQLIGTLTSMLVSVGWASVGVVRIARAAPVVLRTRL